MHDLAGLRSRVPFTAVDAAQDLAEAVRLGHLVVVLSRRPGRVREVVAIDAPIVERREGDPALDAVRQRLWDTMRDEARAANAELADA